MRRARPQIIARLVLVLAAVAALLVVVLSGPLRQAHPVADAPGGGQANEQITWNGQMAQFLARCGPGVKAAQVGREVDWCQKYLAARGVTQSRLEVLSGTNMMLGSSSHFGKPLHYAFTLYAGRFNLQFYTALRKKMTRQ